VPQSAPDRPPRRRAPLVASGDARVDGNTAGAPTAKPRARARSAIALLLLAAVAAAALGCSRRVRRTPDDTLVMVIESLITDVDPRYAPTNYDLKLSRLLAPGLTTIDTPDLAPALALAADITQVDDLTWDVTLRDGLRFSDGGPVTADDVVFTFGTTIDPAFGSIFYKQQSDRFASVEALDRLRARFHLKQPLATFWGDLDFGILSRAAAGPDGRYPGGRVVGAGPYRIAAKATERLLLEANPYFAGPAPLTPRVEIRAVRDASARTMMLIGGSADLAQNTLRVDLVDDVAERERVHMVSGPSAILSYFMMNGRDPLFRDVRVRKAFAYAIDRPRLVAAKFNGRAVLATGLVAPGHWAYEPDVTRYTYDKARAMRLLDEAGYPDPDGPGGKPRFTISYKTSADQFRLAVARIIAEQLGEIGIDVEVRSFEFGTFFADIKKGNFQVATMQTTDITDPDFFLSYFNSDRIPDAKNPDVQNRWAYSNPRVDALTEQGRNVVDQKARYAIYSEVQKILADEVPIVPLWHEDNVALLNVTVDGFRVFPSARLAGLALAYKK
jgi:peptide/nickel transport system substrate-binding protein